MFNGVNLAEEESGEVVAAAGVVDDLVGWRGIPPVDLHALKVPPFDGDRVWVQHGTVGHL